MHELPVDQAELIAPLVTDQADFDQPGLEAAIAGLGAATAAVDGLPFDPDGDVDTVPSLDGLDEATATAALEVDPAHGIDAGDVAAEGRANGSTGGADEASGGSAPAADPSDADDAGTADTADTAADDLRFGESVDSAAAGDSGDEGAGDDFLGEVDADPGAEADGFSGFADEPGNDPASLFDHGAGVAPYDPADEAVGPDDTDELDDGFPY